MASSKSIWVVTRIRNHKLRLRSQADTRRMNALCNMKASEVKLAYPEFAKYNKSEAIFKILVRENRLQEDTLVRIGGKIVRR